MVNIGENHKNLESRSQFRCNNYLIDSAINTICTTRSVAVPWNSPLKHYINATNGSNNVQNMPTIYNTTKANWRKLCHAMEQKLTKIPCKKVLDRTYQSFAYQTPNIVTMLWFLWMFTLYKLKTKRTCQLQVEDTLNNNNNKNK